MWCIFMSGISRSPCPTASFDVRVDNWGFAYKNLLFHTYLSSYELKEKYSDLQFHQIHIPFSYALGHLLDFRIQK